MITREPKIGILPKPTNILYVFTFIISFCHDNSTSFIQLRGKFTVDDYSHYLFTPRDLTTWVLSFLRYDLAGGTKDNSTDHVFQIFAYEARRLFRDRLVGPDGRNRFDNMLQSVIMSDWSANIFDTLDS